ncbi:MAG TPA: undecaprenyldiphospho-muramoylpentapeptide beta-N-acetylglucosaminyltransferase [Firmicutes bacterium]|nr:undecaprenyldiphospho-muramoylpentapeptide beta-N-acetylglucosaminyltransferase [Bacillota bacterium]
MVRVLLTGGGTGGHVYPALTIGEGLRAHDPTCQLLYVGTETGLEAELAPRAGIPFAALRAQGLAGKSWPEKARGVAITAWGCLQAQSLLRRFRPHVVVGTGGYVSGPVLAAALWQRVPFVLQEQNAFPGATNRLLARYARYVFLPFETARHAFPPGVRTVMTGNPVRSVILTEERATAAQALGIDPQKDTILILGGSLGAGSIVTAALQALPLLRDSAAQFILITGRGYFQQAKESLGIDYVISGNNGARPGDGEMLKSGNAVVCPYLHQMEKALAAADLVVCRAGGMTLAEVTARGLPAIIIPSPNVANDHQRHNALAVAGAGGAIILEDRQLHGALLADTLRRLLADPERREKMAGASRSVGRPQALRKIVALTLRAARRL